MPEKARQKRQDRPMEVKTRDDFETFKFQIYKEWVKETGRGSKTIRAVTEAEEQVSAVSQEIGATSQNPRKTSGPTKKLVPNAFERKERKCGRCLTPGHIRGECKSTNPKCSYCLEAHEYFKCPRNPHKAGNKSASSNQKNFR